MRATPNALPTENVANFIRTLALQTRTVYHGTVSDGLAGAITRHADDEVTLDEVEKLIIALERVGALQSRDVLPLHHRYLKEKMRV